VFIKFHYLVQGFKSALEVKQTLVVKVVDDGIFAKVPDGLVVTPKTLILPKVL